MERYLQVKNIYAPVDEVRFVVDTVHHTLAPELTPEDFALEDGTTINVMVPAEYMVMEEEEAAKEPAAVVPEQTKKEEEEGGEGKGKAAEEDFDDYM